MALKRISARPMSFSKSLEDITSQPTISTTPATPTSSFSDPEQMKKMSASVPAFLQEENDGRDSDTTSESSFRIGRQMRTGSTCTNLSISSGMASLSSVTGSVMSIYSGEFGNVEVRGTIQFAINYVQKLGEFHIFVVRCRELAVADPRKNRSDPYVKCYLLPDKTKLGKRKTTVKKKTLNPTYNEILRYRIDMEILKSQTLNVSVWHNDTFGRNSFLGEVDVDLSEWDFKNTQMNDFTLKPKSHSGLQPTDYRGEMNVALRFLPTVSHSKRTPRMGEVQILVKECKNLPVIRGAIDPFVKCNVLPDTSRKGRQKTRVVKRTADPVFNQTMVYDGFQAEDLREACVELTVWDHDRLSNHFLGGVRLSLGTGKSYGAVVDWMDSNAQEAMLWERMMDSHNEWVEDVLPLRMLMMARGMSK
ncbi:synaptotagmin-like protein 2 isoform X4 [Megalops cyprinoides]|nr:synaptotagmin-like protein 2 isoform X4 [Megalops cyprinoides]XP_036379127.1 synaptotagmin-like protein 2 isoform X4 [Megalops cyprinoides]